MGKSMNHLSQGRSLAYLLIFSFLLFSSCQTSTDNPILEKYPNAPTDLTAMAVEYNQINLTWKDNSADETEFRVQRKDSIGGSWGEVQILAADTESYQDKTVSPGFLYFYRVWAFNSNGGSSFAEGFASPLEHLEAIATIDQGGGIFEVSDPSSQIFGARILVPPETVNVLSTFSLYTVSPPDTQLPDDIEQDGPAILLECSSMMAGPVSAELPFLGERIEDELRMFFNFRAESRTWNLVEPLPGENGSILRALIWNSSPYIKGRMYIAQSAVYSNFNIVADPVRANNSSDRNCIYDTDGPSVGFSLLAEEYFRNFAKMNKLGLKCWWEEETSYNVACNAQNLFQNDGIPWEVRVTSLFATLGISTGSMSDLSYVVDYWKRQLITGIPVSVLMLPLNSLQGHSVLIIGWEKTTSFAGKFIVYENQDNTAPREIDYIRSGSSEQSLMIMAYVDAHENDYELFVNASTFSQGSASITALIASTGQDEVGDPACGTTPLIKIAYSSQETGTGDIYVMTIDSYLNIISNERLTTSPAYEDYPCWSPDGERIAYWSNATGSYQIWIMNKDGSNQYQLTNSNPYVFPVAWSLDGKYIYAGGNSYAGDSEVAKVQVATGIVTTMTSVQGYNTQIFDLNRDQTKITFVRGYEGNGYSNQLYIADFQISNFDFINKVLISDVLPAPKNPHFSWSGNQITFHLDQYPQLHGVGVVNQDGTGFNLPIPIQNGFSVDPDWIDEFRLVYTRGTEYDRNLYVLDLRYPALTPIQLTSSPGLKGGISVLKPRT